MVEGAEGEGWRGEMGEVGVEEGGPGGRGGHGELAEGRNGCGCWTVVCVVGLLDVGCWFLTVGRWPLVARVGGFWIGCFLDWDWIGCLKRCNCGLEIVDYWFEKVGYV